MVSGGILARVMGSCCYGHGLMYTWVMYAGMEWESIQKHGCELVGPSRNALGWHCLLEARGGLVERQLSAPTLPHPYVPSPALKGCALFLTLLNWTAGSTRVELKSTAHTWHRVPSCCSCCYEQPCGSVFQGCPDFNTCAQEQACLSRLSHSVHNLILSSQPELRSAPKLATAQPALALP
jgi:hypothetical protein